MKVEQFYNKNQFIITGNNKITFQSYESTIATIDNIGNLTLYTDFDYSKTTQKHLYLFIEDYCHKLNNKNRALLHDLATSKNKRNFLQNLIDNKKINYKEGR